MHPIKILQIIPSSNSRLGGAETVLLGLLDKLNRDFFKSTICVIEGGPLNERVKLKGFDVVQLPLFKGNKDIGFLLKLTCLLNKLKPDIIHSHTWFANLCACIGGAVIGVPVISTYHSNYKIETLYEKLMQKIIFRLSRKIVNVSSYQVKHFGFPHDSEKVKVIRNGVMKPRMSELDSMELDNLRRKELGILSSDKIITFIGNFKDGKGHIFLVKAMEIVSKKYLNARLLLVGEGILRSEIEEVCKERMLDGKVRFLGYRDDVLNILAISDIFVSPSLSETTSIAILEAMAAGLPVIATDVGGNPEIINNNETGLLVPPMDPQALADNILLLLEDENRGLELSRNAIRRVEDKYNLEHMVEEYENLYFGIIEKRRGRTRLSGTNRQAGGFQSQ
jgi:glycosyltransferase involved in cell wall biosynthesis